MLKNVGNWVGELSRTEGDVVNIVLVGAFEGYTTFANLPTGEDFYYVIMNGNNREAGIGSYTNAVLSRTTVTASLLNGVYEVDTPVRIPLSGESQVFCTFNKVAFDQLSQGLTDLEQLRYEFDQLKVQFDAYVLGYNITDYRIQLPALSTPAPGYVSRDNDDPTLTTIIYMNEIDIHGDSSGLVFANIKEDDEIEFSLDTDPLVFERYVVDGIPLLVAGVWNVPVSYLDNGGTLVDNNRIYNTWYRDEFAMRMNDLVDVDDTARQDRYALLWDSTNEMWLAKPIPFTLEELEDTDIVNPDPDEILLYELGKWVNKFNPAAIWRGLWSTTTYPKNSMVLDAGWLMISNQETDERPSPQPVGEEYNVYVGTLASYSQLAKQIIFGSRYTFPQSGCLNGYRVDTVAGNLYQVYLVEDPLGTPKLTQLVEFTASIDGWTSFGANGNLVTAGTVFDLAVIVREPEATPSTFTGNWTYNKTGNPQAPTTGTVNHSNNQPSLFSISKTDADAVDRSAELAGLEVGDVIDSGFLRWAIQSIIDQGTYYDYQVSPATQDPNAGVIEFTFETTSPTPISYGSEINYWAGTDNVQGLFIVDGAYEDIIPDENAYGVDLVVQDVSTSDHWDVMSNLGSSSSGGGSGAEYLDQLLDVNAPMPGDSDRLSWDASLGLWVPKKSTSVLGIITFDYRMALPSDPTPVAGDISRDTDDPTTATILYVNEEDSAGDDLSPYFEYIDDGDWLNLYDRDNAANAERYDVVGPAVLVDDVWQIPVTPYDNIGDPLINNQRVILFWRRVAVINASSINYDNTASGLLAENVQDAIDELDENVDTNTENIATNTENVAALDLSQYAMSQAEFDALREKRIRDGAGSGFAEWGKHDSRSTTVRPIIGEGMFALADDASTADVANTIQMGNESAASKAGISRAVSPIVVVNGVAHNLAYINNPSQQNWVIYPPATDGTVTYDSDTGVVTQHASAAEAFASETDTNKVVIDRQDYCFLESWHELIDDKDLFVPLGNVQYGATTYNGIALSLITSLGVGQGYSAFGEWDSETVGYGAKWSTLSDADKRTALTDPDNNIYLNEDGELVQVRYRVRTIAGAGNGDWLNTNPQSASEAWMCYANIDGARLVAQGSYESVTDWDTTRSAFRYGTVNRGNHSQYLGAFETTEGVAGYDLCFAIPICMVNRLNQGAYHPVWNPQGAKKFCSSTTGTYVGDDWFNGGHIDAISVAECFMQEDNATYDGSVNPARASINTGYISSNSGRPDGQYYDAIYAAYAKDVRSSSLVRPLAEIREEYLRESIAGEVRGWERAPFTEVDDVTISGQSTGGNYINVTGMDLTLGFDDVYLYDTVTGNIIKGLWEASLSRVINIHPPLVGGEVGGGNAGWVVATTYLDQRAAEHTWTDLIGDPERLLATFPEGVQGQWVPALPDNTSKAFPLSRKSLDVTISRETTTDNGASWLASTRTVDAVTNDITVAHWPEVVELIHYTTPAHFTEDADNTDVKHLGNVTFCGTNQINHGCLLASTLIGKVLTGSAHANISTDLNLLYTGLGDDNSGNMKLGPFLGSQKPTHHPLPQTTNSNDSPAVKALGYLTAENGKFNLQLAYKEMIYDGTWGDDNQFQIIDGQSTLTDTNGNTVLYGTAKLQDHCVQYFYPEWKESGE